MRRHRQDPERIKERSRRRLRFAVLDAKKLGLTTRGVHEITTQACEDWRYMNG